MYDILVYKHVVYRDQLHKASRGIIRQQIAIKTQRNKK